MTVTIDEGLHTFLLATAGVTALVGNRIYGMIVKQGSTFPCISIQRITTPRILTHDTAGTTGVLAHPRFQIDVWGVTESSVKAVTDALRAALNGYSGSLGMGAVSVQAILASEEVPEYEPTTELYRIRSEYVIWQSES